MVGCFVDGFGVVVEFVEFFEECLEGLGLVFGEGEFVGGELFECWYGLEECGGCGDENEVGSGGGVLSRGDGLFVGVCSYVGGLVCDVEFGKCGEVVG